MKGGRTMKCPGQDMRYWKPGDIFEADCPKCGVTVEFYKDDTTRKCPGCGNRFANPEMDFGCAAYCKFAEQCLGTLPKEFVSQQADLLKDRVAVEMKRFFKSNFKAIGRATRVARHAEALGRKEGGDLSVILSAAYLHDIGADYPEEARSKESGRIARGIMEGLEAPPPLTEEVVGIIETLGTPPEEATPNFKVIADAIRLEEMERHLKDAPDQAPPKVALLTPAGEAAARELHP